MTKPKLRLGELELEVLKLVWEHQPCTVQEVADILCHRRGLARTTILTVMQRLHAKGFLKRRKIQGLYHYYPTKERRKVIGKLIGQFVDRVLDGSPVPFVAYLAEAERLTEEQAAALKRVARELKEKGRKEGQS